MKKLFIYVSTLVIVSLLCVSNIKVNAAYNYTPDKDEIASAESLVAMKSVDSSNLVDVNGNLISGEYSFGSLYDVADDEENIYNHCHSDAGVSVVQNGSSGKRRCPDDMEHNDFKQVIW